MQVLRLTLVGLLAAMVFAPNALAGELTLHPSGFGTNTYSAWKAKQGQADSGGSAFEALYFQKFTLTSTPVAAFAVFKGEEGIAASDLTELYWDHREDGHCGAGAPRWNVVWDAGAGPMQSFLGCAGADHDDGAAGAGPNGVDFCRDTYTDPAAQALPPIPPGATITSLSIAFDEGTDNPQPPIVGCDFDPAAAGSVHLDNITVEIDGTAKTWTSARDNAN